MDCFRGRVNGLDAAGVPFCFQPRLAFPSDMKFWVAPVSTRAYALPHCVAIDLVLSGKKLLY